MVSDEEPRYWLVNSSGDVEGSLYINASDQVVIQEGTQFENEIRFDQNQLEVTTPITAERGEFQRLDEDTLIATHFPGGDPDARLDNALAAADDGDEIRLESAFYTTDRTISNVLTITGVAPDFEGSNIAATWTISGNGTLVQQSYIDATDGVLQIDGSNCIVTKVRGGEVEFTSNSNSSLIDTSIPNTITDNGIDTVVGDIA
jgi:hypothetical protein